MTPPKRANLPGSHTPYLIRPGDTGQTLVDGHVRLKSKGVTKAGTITAYDDTTSQYSTEFQDFSSQTWTLRQVKKHWRTQRHGDSWSESDKRRLRAQIRRIWGRSERVCAHTTHTPFPSLLQSTEWTETETWYTCDMKWNIPASVRTYTGTSGKRHGWYRRSHIVKKTATFFSTYAVCTTVITTSTGTYVSHHRMEDRPFGPLSNYTALVNARGAFASRYWLPKSVIPQRTRGQGNLPIPRQRARHLSQLRGVKFPGRRTYHSVADRYSPHR